MRTRMCPDDVAWEQAEDIADSWLAQFLNHDILRPVGNFVLDHNGGIGTEFAILKKGSYNISLRLKDKIAATIIRLSLPGAVFFPDEKVVNEVAIMLFLTDKTSIPIPFVHYSGTKNERPLGLSPFIIMDYCEHENKMYDALNTPGCPIDERGILDPAINKDRLEILYGQLAGILLQLFTPSLPRIGSLSQIDDFTWEVTCRPLSMNMNELVRLGNLPRSKLPDLHTIFTTASSYFEALADLNIKASHTPTKRFHKKLTNPLLDEGPFKVWCDDLRPANVLLHENLKIAGVVDWGFTYAAPAEFSYAPPWWLLIEKPEYWPEGLDDWTRVFGYRLKTFLKVMKGHEDSAIQMGRLKEDQRLSGPMYQSWESGDFWVIYAALHSFAFDVIYWQKIDPRFFGPSEKPEEAWKERLVLLDEKEKYDMEQPVARKLEEMKTRILAWDPDEYTMAFSQ
ncbi:phosphotransferase family protein [Penicillium brasilianum]|uniref:Phosphotransferase family protein n=1 Tax=Penicillium brasilianum TaxID=104259 RepID=A0A1S9RCH6_PENBI|nr:phosphotransferase family protein [Penicillium brasilianum]